jgi:hypothetical protein
MKRRAAEPNDSSQLAPQWLHAMLQRLRAKYAAHIGQLIGERPLRGASRRIASEPARAC